jgi:hypothetical protein
MGPIAAPETSSANLSYTPYKNPKTENQEEDFASYMDINLREKLAKFYIWNIASHGVESWTLRKVDQKYLKSSEM